MSFFQKIGDIFNPKGESDIDFEWQSISDKEGLRAIVMASNSKPQIIYKHSTRCATSFFALKNVQRLSKEMKKKADFYMVDVIGERKVSFQIAEDLGVRHESPQLIILKDGEVSWHGSHHRVNVEALEANI